MKNKSNEWEIGIVLFWTKVRNFCHCESLPHHMMIPISCAPRRYRISFFFLLYELIHTAWIGATGMSKNLVGTSLCGEHYLPLLIGIGLNNLPKSGGGVIAPLAQVPTALGHESDKGLGGTKKVTSVVFCPCNTCCISTTRRSAHWSKINQNNPEILKFFPHIKVDSC